MSLPLRNLYAFLYLASTFGTYSLKYSFIVLVYLKLVFQANSERNFVTRIVLLYYSFPISHFNFIISNLIFIFPIFPHRPRLIFIFINFILLLLKNQVFFKLEKFNHSNKSIRCRHTIEVCVYKQIMFTLFLFAQLLLPAYLFIPFFFYCTVVVACLFLYSFLY